MWVVVKRPDRTEAELEFIRTIPPPSAQPNMRPNMSPAGGRYGELENPELTQALQNPNERETQWAVYGSSPNLRQLHQKPLAFQGNRPSARRYRRPATTIPTIPAIPYSRFPPVGVSARHHAPAAVGPAPSGGREHAIPKLTNTPLPLRQYATPRPDAGRLDAEAGWVYGPAGSHGRRSRIRPTTVRRSVTAGQPAARQVLLLRVLRPRERGRPVALLPAPRTRPYAAVVLPHPSPRTLRQ